MCSMRSHHTGQLVLHFFPAQCKFWDFHFFLVVELCLLCQSLTFIMQSQLFSQRLSGCLCRFQELLLCAFLISCPPALSLVLLSNLPLPNSEGLPYSAWATPPCIMVWGIPPGKNLGDHGDGLICFHSHRNHGPALLVGQHLKIVISYILSTCIVS